MQKVDDTSIVNLCTTIVVAAFLLYRELTRETKIIEVPVHRVK